MKLKELLQGIEIRGTVGSLDRDISDIHYDSREVTRNSLFVALRGWRRDGHEYLREAIGRGASTVVIEEDAMASDAAVTFLRVSDARKALALMAGNFHGHPGEGLHLIGVTGTNGKTTITYLVQSILNAAGEKAGRMGTISYATGQEECPAPHTTPEPVHLQLLLRKMADAGCRFVVMEVSSHALAQDRVYGCRFDTAVFTNLTRDHLDYHSDMESYFQAKARLFQPTLLKNRAVVHGDDPYGRKLLEEISIPVWSYGIDAPWDVRSENMSSTLDGIRFDAVTPIGVFPVHSKLLGRYNVVNILGAIGAALSFGISPRDISQGVRDLENVPGRMEKIDEGQDFTVIVDYAHTEDALSRLLQALDGSEDRKIIVVFGCGGDRDRGKRPLMGKTAAMRSDRVILTTDNPRNESPSGILSEIETGVRDAMEQGISRIREYRIIEDRAEAIREAIREAGRGDWVVIAGKGHEAFQIIGGKRVPFDDREVARAAIRERVAGSGERNGRC